MLKYTYPKHAYLSVVARYEVQMCTREYNHSRVRVYINGCKCVKRVRKGHNSLLFQFL